MGQIVRLSDILEERKHLFSDIIILKEIFGLAYYYNTVTKKVSRDIKKIARGKYIVVRDAHYFAGLKGIYVEYLEESDILLIANMEYNRKKKCWKLEDEYCIDRYKNCFYNGEPFHSTAEVSLSFYDMDICGQSFILEEDPYYCLSPHTVMPLHLRQECAKFFGGCLVKKECNVLDDSQRFLFIDNSDDLAFSFFNILGRDTSFGRLDMGCFDIELPDISEEIQERLKEEIAEKIADAKLEYYENGSLFKLHYFIDSCIYGKFESHACYLQRYGDSFIQRHFRTIYDYIDGEFALKLFEYKRVMIAKGMLFSHESTMGKLIGYDENIKDTFLEYYMEIFSRDSSGFIFGDDTVTVLMELINSPSYEKLFNLCPNQTYKRFMIEKLLCSKKHADVYLNETIGEFNPDGKSFSKIFGVPKCFLLSCFRRGFFGESCEFEYVGQVKIIFCTPEAREYLIRLNDKSCKNIVDKFSRLGENQFADFLKSISFLMKRFGYRNWNSYFTHLWQLAKKGGLSRYTEYIDMLETVGDNIKFSEWKLKIEDIAPAKAAIMPLYAEIVGEQDKERAKAFVLHINEAQIYHYSSDELFIRPPKSIGEIINEGFSLHHCVGSFIDAVSYGETMVLFLRKSFQPDKPFYTVEVRDGRLRQCRGFDNCKVTPEIRFFLEEFCRKKDILYDGESFDRMLGVEE